VLYQGWYTIRIRRIKMGVPMSGEYRPWWENHENLALVASHMADSGATAHDVAYMVEKPWKFTDQYDEATAQ
jgi:hypothetical protein